jgi:hypothetical protein
MRKLPFGLQVATAVLVPFVGVLGAARSGASWDQVRPPAGLQEQFNFAGSVRPAGCNIKGNVSIDTGERIYHVPGGRYYAATKVEPQFGERWFCSEADARAAGWRKSKV